MTQEIITITVEAGQMTARRKSRKTDQRRPVPVWAIVKYAALTIAGIMLFREGAARALAYRTLVDSGRYGVPFLSDHNPVYALYKL